MQIEIIKTKITPERLEQLAQQNYVNMIKGVADLNRKIIALGGEMHADAEDILLEDGSVQEDLWGFNIYIDRPRENRIMYTSLINIRPRQGNMSMEISDPQLIKNIKNIIDLWVE